MMCSSCCYRAGDVRVMCSVPVCMICEPGLSRALVERELYVLVVFAQVYRAHRPFAPCACRSSVPVLLPSRRAPILQVCRRNFTARPAGARADPMRSRRRLGRLGGTRRLPGADGPPGAAMPMGPTPPRERLAGARRHTRRAMRTHRRAPSQPRGSPARDRPSTRPPAPRRRRRPLLIRHASRHVPRPSSSAGNGARCRLPITRRDRRVPPDRAPTSGRPPQQQPQYNDCSARLASRARAGVASGIRAHQR